MSDDNLLEEQDPLIPAVTQNDGVIIKFETSQHSISAVLMADTLLAFNSSVVNFAQNEHVENTTVSVQSVKNGCIEIAAIVSSLHCAGITIDYMKNIWENLKAAYELLIFLAGEPPAKATQGETNTIVENVKGETQTFNNCVFNQYIGSDNTFIGHGEKLLHDLNLSGVSLLDEKRNTKLTIPRESFKTLIPYKKAHKDKSNQVDQEEIFLTIATVNLNNPKKMWKFLDEHGIFYSAKIKDEKFIKNIQQGNIAFRQGDKLRCILEIQKKYNPALDSYEIASRTIIQVLQYFPRAVEVQPQLPMLD